MKVRVLCLGRSARDIDLPEGGTVEQAIQAAGFPKDSAYQRFLNGAPVFDTDTVPENGVLVLSPAVKGGC